MKKVIIIIVVMLLGVGAYLGISFLNSPEYALYRIKGDVEEMGMDGLKPHLTGDAEEMLDTFTSITDSDILNSVLDLFGEGDYMETLKSDLKEVKWELGDIMKGDDRADVVLEFNYKNEMAGTVEIEMTEIDGDWKISGVEFPDFADVE